MMGDTIKPNQKKPEKSSLENYNPGNMSGKTIDIAKDEVQQENKIDRLLSRKGHVR